MRSTVKTTSLVQLLAYEEKNNVNDRVSLFESVVDERLSKFPKLTRTKTYN